MKYPQPAEGEERDDPFFDKKSARSIFLSFIQQIWQKQSLGFVSESKEGKIFSFETYLREMKYEADVIAGYCKYAKEVNLLKSVSEKEFESFRYWAKGLSGAFWVVLIILVLALVLYVLSATALMIFDVSLWNWRSFLGFTGKAMLVLIFGFIVLMKRKKKGDTGGQQQPPVIIKYFDNDELTFTKAKSKLFVDK